MNWRQVSVACLLATAACLPIAVQASERSQLSTLEQQQQSLTQQIAAREQQIEDLRSKPSPEQKELADARQEVADARAAHNASPGADTEARLKNAEFKVMLAQRKFDKANADVGKLQAEIAGLKQQLAANERQIHELKARPATPAPAVADREQQKLAEARARARQQAEELERTRQQNEAAHQEIERLKALLAQKQAAAASKPAAAPAPKPVQPPAGQPIADNSPIRQLTTQAAVAHELQTFADRTSSDNGHDSGTNEVVFFKLLQAGKPTSTKMISLQTLGSGQFRGKGDLMPGNYEVVLGFHHWKTRIAAAGQASYVILLNESDAAKPSLSFYDESLEKQ